MLVAEIWHRYMLNRRTQRLLQESGMTAIQPGDEELCLYPEFMIRKISDFLEVAYAEKMLPSLIFLHIMHYNSAEVYRKLRDQL